MSLGHLQDISSRRLQNMSLRDLQDMSSRLPQDMSSRRLQDVFGVTIFRLPRRLHDVLKTSLQDVFKQGVFKTCWKTKNCYAEEVLKTSSRRLEDQQMFAGMETEFRILIIS